MTEFVIVLESFICALIRNVFSTNEMVSKGNVLMDASCKVTGIGLVKINMFDGVATAW